MPVGVYLGVKRDTMYRWIARKKMPTEKGTVTFFLRMSGQGTNGVTGTGKTFAPMRMVARLLQVGAGPNRMLVCAFTRTADLCRKEFLKSFDQGFFPVSNRLGV